MNIIKSQLSYILAQGFPYKQFINNLFCIEQYQTMENKENYKLHVGFERQPSLSMKLSSKINTINNEIELEKEYLAKLKTQRQKTERLYTEFMKTKAETEKLKQTHKKQIHNLEDSLKNMEEEINKKNEQVSNLEREVRNLKLELERMSKDKADCMHKISITYQTEIEELRNKINGLNQTVENKNKMVSSLKKNHTSKIKQLELENQQYKNDLKATQDKSIQYDNKKREHEKEIENMRKNNEQVSYNLSQTQSQFNCLKLAHNNLQLENQSALRKINDLEKRIRYLQEQNSSNSKKYEHLQDKFEKCEDELEQMTKCKDKLEIQLVRANADLAKQKQQNTSKEQSIKQFQSKILKQTQMQDWKQRYLQLQSKNHELQQKYRSLKQDNQAMLEFTKHRQQLERERISLMQNQMEQIHKFEQLLKDVR